MFITNSQIHDWERGLWQVETRGGSVRRLEPFEIHKQVIEPLLNEIAYLERELASLHLNLPEPSEPSNS